MRALKKFALEFFVVVERDLLPSTRVELVLEIAKVSLVGLGRWTELDVQTAHAQPSTLDSGPLRPTGTRRLLAGLCLLVREGPLRSGTRRRSW